MRCSSEVEGTVELNKLLVENCGKMPWILKSGAPDRPKCVRLRNLRMSVKWLAMTWKWRRFYKNEAFENYNSLVSVQKRGFWDGLHGGCGCYLHFGLELWNDRCPSLGRSSISNIRCLRWTKYRPPRRQYRYHWLLDWPKNCLQTCRTYKYGINQSTLRYILIQEK